MLAGGHGEVVSGEGSPAQAGPEVIGVLSFAIDGEQAKNRQRNIAFLAKRGDGHALGGLRGSVGSDGGECCIRRYKFEVLGVASVFHAGAAEEQARDAGVDGPLNQQEAVGDIDLKCLFKCAGLRADPIGSHVDEGSGRKSEK